MTRPWVRRCYDEKRLWVWMPYQGGSNRLWIKEALGTRTRPEWNKPAGRWEIARPHLKPVVAALIDRFGEVDVYLEFLAAERCDTRCVEAAGDNCECSCMGENHGGAGYWRRWRQVGDTTLIDLGRIERHYLVRRDDLIRGKLRRW